MKTGARRERVEDVDGERVGVGDMHVLVVCAHVDGHIWTRAWMLVQVHAYSTTCGDYKGHHA